jgi:hypothetical protein
MLQDVARDGRVLVSSVNSRVGILFLSPESPGIRDLAWFLELSYSEGRNTAMYLRKTDGSPAVKVGWGTHPALSPDAKWVACIRNEQGRSEVALLPTGAGESRTAGAAGMLY